MSVMVRHDCPQRDIISVQTITIAFAENFLLLKPKLLSLISTKNIESHKNIRALIRFGEAKAIKTDDFLF